MTSLKFKNSDISKHSEKIKALFQQTLLAANESSVPEIQPCSKCGRIILCGVNKLCPDDGCPQKPVAA